MTDDTLREECEAMVQRWINAELETPHDAVRALIAFARAQQAKGLREAGIKYAEWINGHEFLEVPRFEDWCQAQATAREQGA
ncbi:MAG: hypothetical protein ABT940_03645 [Alphaproteobacteria bacterium]